MDDERLSDDQRALLVMLDRDLQRELQVVPAPDFVARVWQNIGETPIRVNPWRTWWVPATLAATVFIGVLGMLGQRNVITPRLEPTAPREVARVDSAQPIAPGIQESEATRPISRPPLNAPVRSISRSPRAVARPAPAIVVRSVREAEVLVAPGDERALLRFMALTHTGRIDSSSLDSIFTLSAEELVIAPITIEPLPLPLPERDKPAGSGPPEPPSAVNALLTGLR